MTWTFRTFIVLASCSLTVASAQIIVSTPHQNEKPTLAIAERLADPFTKSLLIYGELRPAGDWHLYVAHPSRTDVLSVQLNVPLRISNITFRPRLLVIGPGIGIPSDEVDLPFPVPERFGIMEFTFEAGDTATTLNGRTWETYYVGREIRIPTIAGQPYYFLVHEPRGAVGTYALRTGETSISSPWKSERTLISLARVKLGLLEQSPIPWMEIIGAFLFLIGSFTGLGACTMLAQRSYFEARKTASLRWRMVGMLWAGICMTIIGGILLYALTGIAGVALFHTLAVIPILLGSLVFTFGSVASKRPLLLATVLIVLGWLTEVFLLIWQLLVAR